MALFDHLRKQGETVKAEAAAKSLQIDAAIQRVHAAREAVAAAIENQSIDRQAAENELSSIEEEHQGLLEQAQTNPGILSEAEQDLVSQLRDARDQLTLHPKASTKDKIKELGAEMKTAKQVLRELSVSGVTAERQDRVREALRVKPDALEKFRTSPPPTRAEIVAAAREELKKEEAEINEARTALQNKIINFNDDERIEIYPPNGSKEHTAREATLRESAAQFVNLEAAAMSQPAIRDMSSLFEQKKAVADYVVDEIKKSRSFYQRIGYDMFVFNKFSSGRENLGNEILAFNDRLRAFVVKSGKAKIYKDSSGIDDHSEVNRAIVSLGIFGGRNNPFFGDIQTGVPVVYRDLLRQKMKEEGLL
ncbi:MAG: hypothetical protein A3C15_01465 [Candidatus Magasanikbacteria bacterium RIFCSPHIGHO2_02_FULL_50_9b]|uniref:Uncharacterized protein n=1 Tax=Candidatus Magasanikbacteria bacterium RIFCSPHIGHO2_02_FULL_50_9b TaxID=1798682 RepID=A0A1F6M7G8_9BACT|nr:MAG: hypothetical protein A3C15_01465 [Candidatus Magasanikbacteria bacterium RIFCSPHIGHO2_02_FULL_50_9b]